METRKTVNTPNKNMRFNINNRQLQNIETFTKDIKTK